MIRPPPNTGRVWKRDGRCPRGDAWTLSIRAERALETLPVAVIVIDMADTVLVWNVAAERLFDVEAGYELRTRTLALQATLYAMEFQNEIAATGEYSDIGLALRRNVDRSYRRGLELDAAWQARPGLRLRTVANLSRNVVIENRQPRVLNSNWKLWRVRRQLIRHGYVHTTEARAKELRRIVEPLITLAKEDTIAARRRARRVLVGHSSSTSGRRRLGLTFEEEQERCLINGEDLVKHLFDNLGPRAKDRPGGYTRITKTGRRRGDAAPTVVIEIID